MFNITDNLILVYGISDTFPQNSKAFKQLQLQDIMKVPLQKSDIEQIVSITVKSVVTNTHIITSAAGQSCEGQIITGKKLIVEGRLQQKLEYAAKLPDQPIHVIDYITPFSTYIVLGEDIACYTEFEVAGYIEDIYIKQLDERTVFKSVLFLLNAIPLFKL